MIIYNTILAITLGHGYNKNGILSYDSTTHNIIQNYMNISGIPLDYKVVFAQLSNNSCYLMLENNTIVSTGETYKLEGLQNPGSQIYQSSQLNGKNIIQISLSDKHGIALSSTNQIFTFGNNSNGQLGRVTTPNTNTFGQVTTLPNRNSKLIATGAIQDLSFLVYEDAVYAIGQCSHGLCGNALGYTRTDKLTGWDLINISTISQLNITDVYFGPLQMVLQTADGKVYYMGDNTHQQACGSLAQYQDDPLEIPIQDVLGPNDLLHRIKANGYVLAFLTYESKIYYCGCQDLNYCQLQVQNLSLLDIKDNGQSIQILDFEIQYVWQILTPQWVGNYTPSNNQIIKHNLPTTQYELYRRILQNSYASIIYDQHRGVSIQLTGGQTISGSIMLTYNQNITLQSIICTGNSQSNFFCNIPYIVGLVRQEILVSLNDSRYYPVNHYFMLQQQPQTIQIPIYVRNNTLINVNITLQDQNNQQPTNNFSLDMINRRNGVAIFANYSFIGGLSIDIPFDELTLLDEINVQILDQEQQVVFFPLNVVLVAEQPTVQYTLTVTSRYTQVLDFIIDSTNYPAGNYIFNITTIFPSGQIQTDHNQTTTAQGQFQVIFGLSSYGNNQSITLQITGKESTLFKELNTTISLYSNNRGPVTINLVPQFQMVLTVLLSTQITGTYYLLTPDTNASCFQGTLTNQKNISVVLPAQASTWRCSFMKGAELRLLILENAQNYFMIPMIFETNDEVSIDVFVYPVNHQVNVKIENQFSEPVPNYQFEYKVGDNTTWSTATTDYRGSAQFQINLYNTYFQNRNKFILIRGSEQGQHGNIPEQQFSIIQYVNTIELEVKYYAIYTVQISVINGQTFGALPNMQVRITTLNNSIIFTGTSDQYGYVNTKFYEKNGQMFPNQEYNIIVTDPSGVYPELTDNFYTQWEDIYVPVTYYGLQIKLQAYDGILQRFAPSVEIQLDDTQSKQTRRTNNNGEVTFFVSTIVYYIGYQLKIIETDIYKPYTPPNQKYSNQVLFLIVHSWKQYDLKLIVYDGARNISVAHAFITLSDIYGQPQYFNNTDQSGQVNIVFSEKNMTLQENQIYKLVINDVYGIYPEFRQNYSFSFFTRNTSFTQVFYLQIQRIFIMVTNYEGTRLQNVSVDLYSNQNLISTAVTDVAGTAYFYVKYSLYSNNNQLTYKVQGTETFKPVSRHVGIQILESPQLVIKKLFPRIQYIFYIYINDTQDKKNTIQNTTSSVQIQQLKVDFNFNFSNLPNGVYNYDEVVGKINKSQVSDVVFYDENMKEIFKTQITQFNKNLTMRFIEGYNLTFKFNEKYYLVLQHQRKNYQDIKLQFSTSGFFYGFILKLQPKKVNIVISIVTVLIQVFLITIGIMMIVYSSKEVHRLINKYRDIKMGKGEINKNGIYTQEQLIEEAQFISDYVKYDEERFYNAHGLSKKPNFNQTSYSSSQQSTFLQDDNEENMTNVLCNDTVYSEGRILKEDEHQLVHHQTCLFIREYIQ